jgi:hypothetical protein
VHFSSSKDIRVRTAVKRLWKESYCKLAKCHLARNSRLTLSESICLVPLFESGDGSVIAVGDCGLGSPPTVLVLPTYKLATAVEGGEG